MIQKVKEACPGDCANCEIAQSLPNFDYTFCMTYQMFRRMNRMQEEMEDIKRNLSSGKVQFAVSDDHLQVEETKEEE